MFDLWVEQNQTVFSWPWPVLLSLVVSLQITPAKDQHAHVMYKIYKHNTAMKKMDEVNLHFVSTRRTPTWQPLGVLLCSSIRLGVWHDADHSLIHKQKDQACTPSFKSSPLTNTQNMKPPSAPRCMCRKSRSKRLIKCVTGASSAETYSQFDVTQKYVISTISLLPADNEPKRQNQFCPTRYG